MDKVRDKEDSCIARIRRLMTNRRWMRMKSVTTVMIALVLACILTVMLSMRHLDGAFNHPFLGGQEKSKETKYVETLGYNYLPQPKNTTTWLPKLTLNGKPSWNSSELASFSTESRSVLKNNMAIAPHTLVPDNDSLLILSPLKNNADHLERYFELIDSLEYPRHKISIAFLVSDSTDETQQLLMEAKQWYQEHSPEMRFNRFDIFHQDFFYSLPRNQRHLFAKQRDRRIMMARARNYLWTRALGNEQWVLWIDGDLEYYPPSIIHDLMAYDKDVIVPNCVIRKKNKRGKWRNKLYDLNSWQETRKSRSLLESLDDDTFLAEGGDSPYITDRKYLNDFDEDEGLVPLDGVGGTFTLVKAHVHRSGIGFPTWLFQHQVETEGFAKLAKANGFGVFGLPNYNIRHVTE